MRFGTQIAAPGPEPGAPLGASPRNDRPQVLPEAPSDGRGRKVTGDVDGPHEDARADRLRGAENRTIVVRLAPEAVAPRVHKDGLRGPVSCRVGVHLVDVRLGNVVPL